MTPLIGMGQVNGVDAAIVWLLEALSSPKEFAAKQKARMAKSICRYGREGKREDDGGDDN